MYTERNTIVVIPAYEPDANLIQLVRELKEKNLDCIVVNDGSGKEYESVFSVVRGFAKVIGYEANKGKGTALKTAFAKIRDEVRPPYLVVTADADGQHTPADILRIAKEVDKTPHALILGSRKIEDHTPLRSRLGNTITRYVFRLVSGCAVYDTQTGLRAFSDDLMDKMLSIEGNRYEYEMNVLLACARDNIAMKEVPIETVYIENNASSHFNTLKDSCMIYKEILKFSGSSLLSFVCDYTLFLLLYGIFSDSGYLHALVLANVLARFASASMNYVINRYTVFHESSNSLHSAVRYAMLAAGILIMNSLLLRALSLVGIPAAAAKLLTELSLFVFSWIMQRRYVFASKEVIAE